MFRLSASTTGALLLTWELGSFMAAASMLRACGANTTGTPTQVSFHHSKARVCEYMHKLVQGVPRFNLNSLNNDSSTSKQKVVCGTRS